MNTDVKSWVWEEFCSRLEAAEVGIFRSLLGTNLDPYWETTTKKEDGLYHRKKN